MQEWVKRKETLNKTKKRYTTVSNCPSENMLIRSLNPYKYIVKIWQQR